MKQRELLGFIEAARKRVGLSSGKSKLLVQVGHCSTAVGASKLFTKLRSDVPNQFVVEQSGCDGACFAGPKIFSSQTDIKGIRDWVSEKFTCNWASDVSDKYISAQHRIAMKDIGKMSAVGLDDYLDSGGFVGLATALSLLPEDVINIVEKSGLRGRGGAYFPVHLKWRSALSVESEKRVMVINAEEGEPGIFKDRHLMEGAPYRLIEGALISAFATGIQDIFLYVNAEADLSYERMAHAVDTALKEGFLGEGIMGSDFSAGITIIRGAGGYVCGEESTLLNTMEGKRREPRLRPPFPTEAGYQQRPTIVNNVETLCNLPYILLYGDDEFRKSGLEDCPGTKIISLSGRVNTPGAVEVPMGTSISEILRTFGNVDPEDLTGIAIGGPSSGILPADMASLPIKPGLIDENSVMLGAGGIVAIGGDRSIIDAVRVLADYNASESCGKCTPCREGTPRILELLSTVESNSPVLPSELDKLANAINMASLCGLGQAAGNPVLSLLHHFPEKVFNGGESREN